MIRLQPTVVSLTMSEVKELENRRRYRRYLQREENPTSEETVKRKTSPSLDTTEPQEPRKALCASQNGESTASNQNSAEHVVVASLRGLPRDHVDRAEEDESTLTTDWQESARVASDMERLTSTDSIFSPDEFPPMRSQRPRLTPNSSAGSTPAPTPVADILLRSEEPAGHGSVRSEMYKRGLSGGTIEALEEPASPYETSVRESKTASRPQAIARPPSLPSPFSKSSHRASVDKSFTLVGCLPASSCLFNVVVT